MKISRKHKKNLNTARRQTLTRLVVFLAASPVMSRPLSVRSISRSLVPWFCGLVFPSSSLSSLPLSRWTLSYLVAVPLTDWWYCGLSIRILRGTRLRRVVSSIHSFSSAHGSVTRPTTLNLLRLCRCPACCSARPTNSTTFLAKLELWQNTQLPFTNWHASRCNATFLACQIYWRGRKTN